MFKFREYQKEIIKRGVSQCLDRRWAYLSMEVRTGKTLTALGIAAGLGGASKRVVFVTKKKAISSVEADIETLADESINVEVINYESLHKLDLEQHVDIWILDEAHRLGGFPKPSKGVKQLADMIHLYSSVIFLSGTPTPESGSQIFHQLYVLGENSPFKGFNFYQWSKTYVNVKKKNVGHGFPVNDYSDCTLDVDTLDFLSYSQKEAGFKNEKREHFLTVDLKPKTVDIIETLKRDKIFRGNSDVILADTAAKEMQKIHQLTGGTCKLDESGEAIILDTSKVDYIKENFEGDKIAIFYKFKKELELLQEHLNITTDIDEFNSSDKSIALQFVAGREGVKLDKATALVFYTIDFSATTYFQARDRMTTIDRTTSDIYYLVSNTGFEMQVYRAVSKKKNFTTKFYERATVSKENNRQVYQTGLFSD